MQEPVGKAAGRLQCVTERVAEIKERAVAGFALVAGDDRGLCPTAYRDGLLTRDAT